MAGTRKTAADVRPGEGSPTPAEVYRAALLDGRTEAEATELSEARAVELAGGAGGETHPETSPAYVFALIEAWAHGTALDFGGVEVPADVQQRVSELVHAAWDPELPREPAAWDPEHCPTPLTCFPYGAGDGTATCIHGTSTRAPRAS